MKAISIINKVPQEIKKINKKLMNKEMEPLLVGDKVLEQCYLSPENILQLNHMQELCSLSFIFNIKAFSRKERLSLKSKEFALAVGCPVDLPPYAYQGYDTFAIKNGIKEKYSVMVDAIKLFESNRTEAQNTKEKRRTIHDRAHLAVTLKDLYEEYSNVNIQRMTPFSLHYSALNNACAKKGFITDNPLTQVFNLNLKIPFGPWLITNKTKQGYDIIYGKNQQQLVTYLLMSDYLKKNQLEYFFEIDFSWGWDRVLDTQLNFGQVVCPKLVQELAQFHQNPFHQQSLVKKGLALDEKITKKIEKTQKIKSETLIELDKVKVEFAKEQKQVEILREEINKEIKLSQELKAEIYREQARLETLKTQVSNEMEKVQSYKAEIFKEQERLETLKAEAANEIEKEQKQKEDILKEQERLKDLKAEAANEIEKVQNQKEEILKEQERLKDLKAEAANEIEEAHQKIEHKEEEPLEEIKTQQDLRKPLSGAIVVLKKLFKSPSIFSGT